MAISAQIATLPLLMVLATLSFAVVSPGGPTAPRPPPLALSRSFPRCCSSVLERLGGTIPLRGPPWRGLRPHRSRLLVPPDELSRGPAGAVADPARRPRSPAPRRRSNSSRVWSGPRVSRVSSTPVSRTWRGIASRTCSRASRLAAASATSASSSASAAGAVGDAREEAYAPALLGFAAAKEAASRPLSRFPPETIATVRPPPAPGGR